jgi:hypothetical protein
VGLEPRASRLLDSTELVPLPPGNTKIYKLSQYLTMANPFFCCPNFALIWLSRIDAHLLQFGLRIVERSPNTAEVVSVCCNFCLNFGREEKVGAKRKATKKVTYFKKPFRTDVY